MVDSLTSRFCVIGHPIGHSLSPQIHTRVFRHFNLDFSYTAEDVPPSGLEAFVDAARFGGRPGFNVTIPHKQTILPFLDKLDTLPQRIGAVNTVVNQNGVLIGYNTDVQGFAHALQMSNWIPAKPVVIMGAGGAARAAMEALAFKSIRTVNIVDIDQKKVKLFKSHFEKLHPDLKINVGTLNSPVFKRILKKANLFINATPVGMWPNVADSPLDPSLLPKTCTVFDMVPKPVSTALIKRARILGMKAIPGIRMLVAQAFESDALFLKRPIPETLFNDVEDDLLAELEEHVRT
ncbi:MAG TPA: shikimate dehydrogenase [bacterium]